VAATPVLTAAAAIAVAAAAPLAVLRSERSLLSIRAGPVLSYFGVYRPIATGFAGVDGTREDFGTKRAPNTSRIPTFWCQREPRKTSTIRCRSPIDRSMNKTWRAARSPETGERS